MPKRLTLEKDGILRDRSGQAVARLVSISIELLEPSDDGGKGADVEVGAQPSLLGEQGKDGGGTQGGPKRAAPADIDRVLAHYVAVIKPRRTADQFGADDRKIVADALKVATVEELCSAVNGCAASDWHMGRDRGTKGKSYKTLSHIFKGKKPNERNPNGRTTRETIEMFLELAAKRGVQSHVPSVDPVRLRQAKQDVRDAHEFPGDTHTVERGSRARQWLREQGYKVEQEGERLTFVPPTA